MSKSNMLEIEHEKKEIGSHAHIFIYRVPKKNHDAIVKLNKQIKNMSPINGPIHSEFFLSQQHRDSIGFCKHNRSCFS